MSLLTTLWQVANHFRGRRDQTHGGDYSASSSESGLQLVAERAKETEKSEFQTLPDSEIQFCDIIREKRRDDPSVEAHQLVFGEGYLFTDNQGRGSWIMADSDSVVTWVMSDEQ
jgi:hypothetical protein